MEADVVLAKQLLCGGEDRNLASQAICRAPKKVEMMLTA